jgi:hypothetical protein
MDNDLAAYIERLELMAFFSGYPLIYALVYFIAGNQVKKTSLFTKKLTGLLPYAYAFTATLFIGLVIKDIVLTYAGKYSAAIFPFSFLKTWGCLAVLCWIPLVARKPVISLSHSLVFFFLLLNDLFSNKTSPGDVINNDMKVYTDSLLLNAGSFVVIIISYLIISRISKKTGSTV